VSRIKVNQILHLHGWVTSPEGTTAPEGTRVESAKMSRAIVKRGLKTARISTGYRK
jgi:hypothetical protein